MPLVVKDRVKETTTTTGTGTITLGGAASGFQSFSVVGNGNTTYYAIVGGTEWEVGIGTYTSSGTTLSRDTVLASSNAGSLVTFSAGTKDVFVTYPAGKSVDSDTAQTLTNKTIAYSNNTLTGVQPTLISGTNIKTINGSTVLGSGNLAVSGGITYTYKTSNYTAVNNDGVLTSTSGGAFTVTLPATPTTGNQVVVADAGNAWGTNNLTIGRNGSTIGGLAEDLVCDITGISVQLVYDGTTWEVYAQIGGGGGTAVTLTGTQTLTNKTLNAVQLTGDTRQVSANAFGYGTGSGGTVTQGAGSGKLTAVTLNTATGVITMNNAALASNATAYFLVNNSLVSAADNILVTIQGGASFAPNYQTWVVNPSAGTFYICLRNISAGSLSEAVVINFAIIKGATS